MSYRNRKGKSVHMENVPVSYVTKRRKRWDTESRQKKKTVTQ